MVVSPSILNIVELVAFPSMDILWKTLFPEIKSQIVGNHSIMVLVSF